MSTITRRYDIDWLRVIAIGLLLVYHVAIGFQSWGIMIGFITNDKPWQSLWLPMTMLNVWRIPFLFFVSGMGVYFSMQSRSWKQLFQERAARILLPYVFGMFCIFPISVMIWQYYYNLEVSYAFNPGHLWFLGNIFVYVIVLAPVLFYLKKNENGKIVAFMRRSLSTPVGLIPVVLAFVAEVFILNPIPYELYAMTWHGFALGCLAFFFGFCFVLAGDTFWKMIQQWRWMFLAGAVVFFITRLLIFQMRAPGYLIVVESQFWIFTVLAFGSKYLNHGGSVLSYLSNAAYPVYIIHMIFLFLGSLIIFPLTLPVELKFVMVLLFTFAGCFLFYEVVIRRINLIRPLFGVKMKRQINVEPQMNEKPLVSGQ
jgi:peptidoglycan/LPS O-acetylase OafA/YrhL